MWRNRTREAAAPEPEGDAVTEGTPLPIGYFPGEGPYYLPSGFDMPGGFDMSSPLSYVPGAAMPLAAMFPELMEPPAAAPPVPVAVPQPEPVPEPNRALRLFGYWVLIGIAWVAVMFMAVMHFYSLIMPDPRATALARVPPNLKIIAADGSFVAERGMRRDYVAYARLPHHFVNAVISTEDRRFRYHFGFDPAGLLRAFVKNMRAGEVVQGGSTVTQQLAKNLFLEPKRTMSRKLEELFIAVWLETKYSKDDIMELYLNRIYFGSGNHGIGAAAYHYFNKKAEALTLAESALLTGLIKAPSSLSPRSNRSETGERTNVVLKNMLDAGFITEDEYNDAAAHPAVLHTPALPPPGFEHVVDWVTEIVPTLTGEARSNLIVETSLDPELQRNTDAIVKRMMIERGHQFRVEQAAVVMLAPDGGVKALFGGMNYDRSQFNRAVKAFRQPASAFKPFVYLTAMESGLKPDSLVDESPLNAEGWALGGAGTSGTEALIPLKAALAKSSNAAAVRVMQHVGSEKVIGTAHRLGISSRLDVGQTLALGTAETTLLELTAAYTTLANNGMGVLPYVVTRVRDEQGRVLFERKPNDDRRVIAERDVGLMNDMLSAVIATGTGRDARLPDRPAAGKTGTSSGYRDGWFVGYTADYTTGVWLGNDRHTATKFMTGGGLPAQIWRAVMVSAHTGLAVRPLPGVQPEPPLDDAVSALSMTDGAGATGSLPPPRARRNAPRGAAVSEKADAPLQRR